MPNGLKKVDAVFEGGGVKGIGLVGAVAITEGQGYQFENVAGTSAGAIIASLVASGYNSSELKQIMQDLDFSDFKDKGLLDKIPLIGSMLSLGFEKGIYEGNFFENWLNNLLKEKGIEKFGDLIIEENKDDPKYRYKLQVIATDITRGKMLILPKDLRDYGYDPDFFNIARAVRMSMSIPFFFEPVILKDAEENSNYIVDGGVLSNYPIWLFDDGTENPAWPTLGYKLVDPSEGNPNIIRGPISLFAALFSTMMEAHDSRYIEDCNFTRTIAINTKGVGTTDFDLSTEKSDVLYESGCQASEAFFQIWDFEKYKENYRKKKAIKRRQRV